MNIAIELSGKHGNVYERALCQRGMIYRFEGKKDDALEDFKEAAQLGNSFAKTMVNFVQYSSPSGISFLFFFNTLLRTVDDCRYLKNTVKKIHHSTKPSTTDQSLLAPLTYQNSSFCSLS